MAKGDSNASQTAINTQGGIAQNNLNNLWGQNTDRTANFQNLFQNAVGQNQNNYSDIMDMFNQFLNPSSSSSNGSNAPKQDFGNLSDPNTWMGLVGNDGQLQSWIKSQNPNLSPDMVNYYAGKIKGQPGANPTEQAGSANYWGEKIAGDPTTGGSGAANNYSGAINNALSGYNEFAQTGGFSPQDIQNLRARAIAPTRAIYANAQANIDRQRALQGGYSPNYTAATAKIARDRAASAADATTNADASIAQLQQQGKLYGLGGEASAGMGARGQNLSAISGAGNLYGTTPGLTNMFGNQVLQSGNQGIQLGGLQNQLAGILTNAQNQHAGIPGNFQSAMGNIGSLFGLGGQIGGVLSKILGMGGGGGMYGASGGSGTPNFDNGIG